MKSTKKAGVQINGIQPITDCNHLIDLPSTEDIFSSKDGIFSKNNQPKGEIKLLSKFFPKNGLYNLL
ncbi:hypothetical protein [Pedobacter nototheniae]|uniref:hypothetical protein n=1 Tax=Pedobacter nototheniae TaxID=2488994 RepID=UPI00292FE57A|nr:hypothetical protein [Pedobacter nototheniae]